MALKKLAITGGVAMGKSTVLRALADEGIVVDSCDKMARQVYLGPEVQKFCAEYAEKNGFQDEITIDITREWLLNKPDFKNTLESIMFPKIIEMMLQSPAQIIEVPLLFEMGLEKYFDKIWVIICSPETQLDRLTNRLDNEEQARKLIALQMPAEEKAKRATRVINTECDLRDIYSLIPTLIYEDKLKD